MTIGERIKQRRDELGITQTSLADAVGTTKQNVYKYENGIITNIPSDKIEALAKALQTTPAALMGWEEVSEVHPITTDPPAISSDDIKAAFFNGADPTLTQEEMDAMWEDARAFLQFKLEQRKKQKNDE